MFVMTSFQSSFWIEIEKNLHRNLFRIIFKIICPSVYFSFFYEFCWNKYVDLSTDSVQNVFQQSWLTYVIRNQTFDLMEISFREESIETILGICKNASGQVYFRARFQMSFPDTHLYAKLILVYSLNRVPAL